MLLLPLKSIQISPNRQRREFDEVALQELSNSIASTGLLHAVVVRSMGRAGFQLVAGERRLRAIENLRFLGKVLRYDGQEVPGDEVPCVTLGELDELKAFEAELEENIRRKDLTWQEQTDATVALAQLRTKQALAAGKEAPKVAAIAQEIRGSSEGHHHEAVRRQLIVGKHMDDPEVKAAKSLDDAFKVLKRKEEAQKNVQLAAVVGATFTADLHQAHNVDCLAWMAAYTGELFDVICTDPPYGIGADKFGDSGGHAAGAHQYDDSYENWQKLMIEFAKLSAKVTKPQAHLYAFCDITRFAEFKEILTYEGWECFRTPLIWHKPTGSRTPWVDFGPQRKYEICLYANKGRKPVTRIFPDLVSYPADENLGWEAQKPVAVYCDFLKRSVSPGDRVLDPFAGSGPIFPAAHELKVYAVGLEKSAQAYGICLRRLDALKAQKELDLNPKALLAGLT